jgi:uncharacterized protein YdhG (YjbR/CyaY superfamily)
VPEVDKYISKLDLPKQQIIKALIAHINTEVPSAELRISYGMPCFYYKDRYLLGIAGFKDHLSIFPGAEPIEKLHTQLQTYKISKGTIQFTQEKQLPDDLLKRIIELCKERIENE